MNQCQHKFVHSYFLPKLGVYEECKETQSHIHASGSDVRIHCKFCGAKSDRFSVGEIVRNIFRKNKKVKRLKADDAPGAVFDREKATVIKPNFPDIIPWRN